MQVEQTGKEVTWSARAGHKGGNPEQGSRTGKTRTGVQNRLGVLQTCHNCGEIFTSEHQCDDDLAVESGNEEKQEDPKVEEEDEVKDGESDEKCDCTHCSLKVKPCLGTPSSGNWVRPSPRRK